MSIIQSGSRFLPFRQTLVVMGGGAVETGQSVTPVCGFLSINRAKPRGIPGAPIHKEMFVDEADVVIRFDDLVSVTRLIRRLVDIRTEMAKEGIN